MRAVARLDHDLEQGALGRQVGEHPLVVDLDDVGAGLAQQVGDLGQRARPIHQIDGELGQPPLAGQLARQHAGQQPRVDVAAAQHEADAAADELVAHLEGGRQAGRAGAFHHRLLDVDQQAHGVLDLGLGHQHDVVDQLAHHRPAVMRPGAFTAMPSASVSPRIGRLVPLMTLYMEG